LPQVEDLAPDPVIVSFAYGVDIVAHQFAMEYKLQTIGLVPMV
jgi:DNA processing protein